MKFILDRMLGKLARWLRLFGYDTLEIREQENEDDLLLNLAEEESRILVSRDRVLIKSAIKKGIPAYPVRSSKIKEQLEELIREFNISIEPVMDRCTLCNSSIHRVDDMAVLKEKEYIFPERLNDTEFWMCDMCGQVYWQGSHWENIIEMVDKLKT